MAESSKIYQRDAHSLPQHRLDTVCVMRLSNRFASAAAAKHATLGAIVLLSLLTGATLSASHAVISIDTSRPGPTINPQLYGIFLEEINHGVDGGLYAELIRNRAFEDSRPPEGYAFRNGRWRDERGFDSGFSRYGYTTNGVPFWSLIQLGDAKGSMNLETTGGITEQSAYCLRLDIENIGNGNLGVANEGFFGIGVKQG